MKITIQGYKTYIECSFGVLLILIGLCGIFAVSLVKNN